MLLDEDRQEIREIGRVSGENFLAMLDCHKKWASEVLAPHYTTMDDVSLIDGIYNKRLLLTWCHENVGGGNPLPCPYDKEFVRQQLLHMCKKKIKGGVFTYFMELWLILSENEGKEMRKQSPCLITAPFFEEVEFMVQELRSRVS